MQNRPSLLLPSLIHSFPFFALIQNCECKKEEGGGIFVIADRKVGYQVVENLILSAINDGFTQWKNTSNLDLTK